MTAATPAYVVRHELAVLCLEVPDRPEAIAGGWDRLETVLGSLRGRRFVGAFDAAEGWYRACVELREDRSDQVAGLVPWTVPGGGFLRVRLRGEPPELYDRIGPAYDALLAAAERDLTRPGLEDYRRRDEVDLLLPVVGAG